jgi:hypothetical protein
MGHERAQAQRLGQGQGLAIVRLRGIDLEAVGMSRDVAEQSTCTHRCVTMNTWIPRFVTWMKAHTES